jgi:hypothetical protein
VLLVGGLLVSTDPGRGAEGAVRPAARGGFQAFPAQLSRIVSARVHHSRVATVRNTSSGRIGRALASLRPTWVTGLIRYRRGQRPNSAEVRAWRKVTGIIRTVSPEAEFDVVLNAKQYRDGHELLRMMDRVRTRLGNDGWFLDFFSTAFRKRPRMIRAAIADAHEHGEWIGGNVFGLAKDRPVPLTADFYAVQDFHLKLDLGEVLSLSTLKPVVYHVHNDPGKPHGGGCRFVQKFSTARRRKLISHRAAQQLTFGFRVSYPVLFPVCVRTVPQANRWFLFSYNAFRDPPMVPTIRRLLDRYD